MRSPHPAQAQSHPRPALNALLSSREGRIQCQISWTTSKAFLGIFILAVEDPPRAPGMWGQRTQPCLPSCPCTDSRTATGRGLNTTFGTSIFTNSLCKKLPELCSHVRNSPSIRAWIPAGSHCPHCTKLVLELPAWLFGGEIL